MKTIDDVLDEFPEWPEGAEWITYGEGSGNLNAVYGEFPSEYWIIVCSREEYEQAKTEREAKKYTIEFCARGGVNIEKVWQPCEILFEGNKFIVLRNDKGREYSRRKAKVEIRPLKTEREKFIDACWCALPAGRRTCNVSEDIFGAMFDSGKFKLVDE